MALKTSGSSPKQSYVEPPQLEYQAYDSWDPAIDEALKAFPEDEDFPWELAKILAECGSGRKKRIWVVMSGGSPVAVAPLRKLNAFAWQPVAQYILPGATFATSNDNVFPITQSLGLNIRLALWRTSYGVPSDRRIYRCTTTPTFGICCSQDLESHWKSTDIWRHLRSARNKWKHLTLKENAPGCTEWVISNWAKKWGVPDDETRDRIAAARFLEERGKHFSLTLFDGDDAVAGQTCLSHRGEMIGQCIYRTHERGGIGNRLLHLTFCWAQEKGFRAIDIGGGHDYKSKFAPPRGERHELTISPLIPYVMERGLTSARWRARSLMERLRA